MARTLHGKVHGRVIELDEDLGLLEGQDVEISLRTVPTTGPQGTGDGILRSEGALADDPHWDAIMDEIHQARKLDRRAAVD